MAGPIGHQVTERAHRAATRVASFDQATVIDLGRAGRQHVLLGGAQADDSPLLLGITVVHPRETTALIEHDTAEAAYVLAGRGWMVTDGESVPFTAGDAVFIPARSWHAIRAAGEEVRMLFVFPTADVPPTRTAVGQP